MSTHRCWAGMKAPPSTRPRTTAVARPYRRAVFPGTGARSSGRTSSAVLLQRAPEIDEDVEAEQQEPDHRRRAVEPAGDLERVPVEEPHGDPTPEQHDRRHDEERREQTHRQLRLSMHHIGVFVRVVPNEAPAGGRQLQDDHRDQGEPDEHVPRHERVHPEQHGRDLDDDGSKQKHSHRCRQALVPVGVQLLSI